MERRDFLKKIFWSLLSLSGLNYTQAQSEYKISSLNHWLPQIHGNSFGFLAFGDMGTGWKTQYDLIQLMAQNSPSLYPAVLLLGDLIYPSARADLIESNIIKPSMPLIQKGFRFYPLLGNHDWKEEKGIHIKKYFDIPDYYTFAIGPAQFWCLNSNDFNNQQSNWLQSSLANSRANWKIVSLHHSPYCAGTVHFSNHALIQFISPILSKYKVDLCLSGHNHLYERTAPIDGVTYVISGGGSALLHKFSNSVNYPQESIKSVYHFLRVRGNMSRLGLEAIDNKGQIFDQLLLSKSI